MKILLTGATGYIGKRLLPVLLDRGDRVVCCVRDANRFNPPSSLEKRIQILEVDFLDKASLGGIPEDIDGAYYLMHSMSASSDYKSLELICARNFRAAMGSTRVQHVVYLSGIVNPESLSEHLASRKAVEDALAKGNYAFTTLRSGIIIGSGSASFEIIRDLVEKLPIMVAPKWIETKCQPIGIRDVICLLERTLFHTATYDKSFDIGGPDILSYKDMMLGYAKVRGLKRQIFVVPVMTPKLSSYWLYFVTATSYKLASALVSSMTTEVVCRKNELNKVLQVVPIGYVASLHKTLSRIEYHRIPSSWKDSLISGALNGNLSEFLSVPVHSCFVDTRHKPMVNRERCIDKIWCIGGTTGWYYANWLWQLRGFIDKVFGGVGLRRGRTHQSRVSAGDVIDFWRVLYADKAQGRLLLFAEMKLPGEAWLEFKVTGGVLWQTATFRPKGIGGRLYWYWAYPLHAVIFRGLIAKLTQ
ncbi:MAG: SDR family oxidoreductase [Flavobacteriales bacterium]